MFVDTSVLVAILSLEDDAAHWSDELGRASGLITSPLVVLEAAMRLSTKLARDPLEIQSTLTEFLRVADIEIVPLGETDAMTAIAAFSAYGKGRGGKAQLNLADCLSYACAKNRGIGLLYKGDDFSHTDLG